VRIPETAANLRRVMNFGQIIQSHALSFFHLSSPDLLLGMDADPAVRNLFGVAATRPELARDGVRLRQIGQQIVEWLGGERIHPSWVVPGGVNKPLAPEIRDRILALLPETTAIAERAIAFLKEATEKLQPEIESFANFPSLFLGLVNDRGELEHYDGKLRVVDASGKIVADQLEGASYPDYLAEAVEPWSYLKSVYYKAKGYPNGMYRVGPLARLNVVDRPGTPRADREWAELRALERGAVLASFHNHYARLIEILYASERLAQILNDPTILDTHVRATAGINSYEGVGLAEAPRGTLLHHYRVNADGLITWANLVIATGHNAMAMNRGVLEVARRFVNGSKLQEGMLNRVEAVVRAFDPCLSCSTHALGNMTMQVQLVGPGGELVDEMRRE
jgi:NAD-reducing hydrogenase large subunit